MRLLVFDLDGTPTATDEVDTKCFIEAFTDAGFDEIDTDRGSYEHTTDAGIAAEIHVAASHYRAALATGAWTCLGGRQKVHACMRGHEQSLASCAAATLLRLAMFKAI